ncbi:MAG: hypothetical protein ACP5NS_04630 [Candidatus Pacearchaeota archaeon]
MSRFKNSLLASLVALPLALGGCKSGGFREDAREPGMSTYSGRMGLGSTGDIWLSVCNDATYINEVSDFPGTEVIINYIGRKSAFVEGEPIEFVLNSDYGIGRPNFRAELIKNGEAVPERRHLDPRTIRWTIIPYPNLTRGNYTVQVYATEEFIGKIDFEVVANPEVKK